MHEALFLKELARQVRRDTLRLFEAAPQDRLTWAPPGTANHVLWHAGHALWLQDHFCLQPLTGETDLSTGWQALFASGSNPAAPPRRWPGREQMDHQLREQAQRIASVLDALHAGQRPASLRHADALAQFVRNAIHGLHDEARHQGEMFLIIKLCRTTAAGAAPGPATQAG